MSILLVDDEPGVILALELNLKREGWTILTADSGAAALRLLNERDDIEVLASDFHMPEMDGAQLINQALAMKPDLYTIVFTGWEAREFAIRSLQVGADDFLDKEQDFANKVAQAIRRGIQQITIERMGRKLLELEDKKDILDLVFRTLRNLERFDGFCLATRRAEGEMCRVERAVDLRSGEELPANSMLSADSAYRYVIDSGKVFLPPVFADAAHRPLFDDSLSIIVVPLLGEQSALGIEHREPDKFKLEDLRFLQRLAQWISLALGNIRLLRERRRREEEQGLLAHALLHEINNPLNNIAMLAQGGEDLEPKDLEDLIQNVNRIRRVLKSSLGRLQREGEPQLLAVDETLEETISRFRDYYPSSSVEIAYEISSLLPPIRAKREMLIYAFMNLLQNGAEATGHRGRLAIRADFVPLRQQIEITFSDDGRGVPPDMLQRIFDFGYTTGGRGHFGQGLALTQEFVQRHGGDITVTSRENAGTTFKIALPVRTTEHSPLVDAGSTKV
jgi:signal transduction histidine kinase